MAQAAETAAAKERAEIDVAAQAQAAEKRAATERQQLAARLEAEASAAVGGSARATETRLTRSFDNPWLAHVKNCVSHSKWFFK